MECVSCLEPLGTRLDCCLDKFVCSNCIKESLEIKCPDCGGVSIPEYSNLSEPYLTQKAEKLLKTVQNSIDLYSQVLRDQKDYLTRTNSQIQNCPENTVIGKDRFNLKNVELALESNQMFLTQLESMKSVLGSTPNLETILKVKAKLVGWPVPEEVALYPIRIWASDITRKSETDWLSCLAPDRLIPLFECLEEDRPARSVSFDELFFSEMGNVISHNVREIHPEYYLITTFHTSGVHIWDPQTREIKFKIMSKVQRIFHNSKWVCYSLDNYLWFTNLQEYSPDAQINLYPVDQWVLFQDELLVLSGQNLVRISLNQPDCFRSVATRVYRLLSREFFIPKGKPRTINHIDGQTIPLGDQDYQVITDGTIYLEEQNQIWRDGSYFDLPDGDWSNIKYLTIISTGEVLRTKYSSGKYTLFFY